MHAEVYKKLRDHYQKHPLGFPKTESEVELKILTRLFREEEAEMALHLTPKPETAKGLAENLGKDPEELASLLERMADKGQVLTLGERTRGGICWCPISPGYGNSR